MAGNPQKLLTSIVLLKLLYNRSTRDWCKVNINGYKVRKIKIKKIRLVFTLQNIPVLPLGETNWITRRMGTAGIDGNSIS